MPDLRRNLPVAGRSRRAQARSLESRPVRSVFAVSHAFGRRVGVQGAHVGARRPRGSRAVYLLSANVELGL